LIEGVEFGALLADKAFDSDWIVAELNERGAQSSSPHPRRSAPLAIDIEFTKPSPHRNFFGKLKEFKRIALRADKTDQSFKAMIARRRAHQFAMNLNSPSPRHRLPSATRFQA